MFEAYKRQAKKFHPKRKIYRNLSVGSIFLRQEGGLSRNSEKRRVLVKNYVNLLKNQLFAYFKHQMRYNFYLFTVLLSNKIMYLCLVKPNAYPNGKNHSSEYEYNHHQF